jgi:hypothetical protein
LKFIRIYPSETPSGQNYPTELKVINWDKKTRIENRLVIKPTAKKSDPTSLFFNLSNKTIPTVNKTRPNNNEPSRSNK